MAGTLKDIRSDLVVVLDFGEVAHLDFVGPLEVGVAFRAVEVVQTLVGAVS